MVKKFLISILIGLIILALVFLGVYCAFNTIIMKSELSKLEGYKLKKTEEINKTFKYGRFNYVITSYYEDGKTYAQNNFLVKHNNKFYYMDSFTDCDMSSYVKDNMMFVHCIGYTGNIVKFKFYGIRVTNEVIEFNYNATPNIGQKNITIEKVTNKNIYLNSTVRKDESIPEGEKVKCSFENNKCVYVK